MMARGTVREWLAANKRSQHWLAMQIGMTTEFVNRWLNNKEKASDNTLRAMESAMSLPTGTLRRDETVKA